MMTPQVRKIALSAHITASVGWVGALAVFLAHALVSLSSEDSHIVRAADLAMGVAAWYVILPLSAAALMTGLVQALGTPWGLLRHYWVLTKLVLTVFASVVLVLKLAPISHLAEASSDIARSDVGLAGLRMSLMVHAVGGLVLLLTALTLAVYKPPGMTAWGIRKQRAQGVAEDREAAGAVLWRTLFWSGASILVVALVLMLVSGEHGPGAHLPPAR